ncbi:hypothetical protein FVA95_24770 [Pseudonocardia sp. EV170527-09]|uniref:hypothetical protein n=1 Tax=Pseudonocardia sp. EV170527-09 TaxID=2603411 RepID=UPI0011F1AC8E|nr:hypothetical protein [Pseudonocardia sp. EV170527-09]KAA1017482.1 hypothetical protein FVA95_24770 [Pseudonocardia sp. EV170527-09]
MTMPSIVLVWADGSYAGKLLTLVRHRFQILVEIVTRTDTRPTFEVLPTPVGHRTNELLGSWQARRLARDYERLPDAHERRSSCT